MDSKDIKENFINISNTESKKKHPSCLRLRTEFLNKRISKSRKSCKINSRKWNKKMGAHIEKKKNIHVMNKPEMIDVGTQTEDTLFSYNNSPLYMELHNNGVVDVVEEEETTLQDSPYQETTADRDGIS